MPATAGGQASEAARATRLVATVLRCYPARWRRRHGDEAAELATLLIRDGTPAGWIAWSYLAGAVREWLTPRPGRHLSTVACALLVAACSLGVSAGLLASAAPARAAPARAATATAAPARAAPATAASTSQARAHCRPGSPEPVPSMIPVMSHPQVIIWEAGHGRSC
jgi:hypothetical protein